MVQVLIALVAVVTLVVMYVVRKVRRRTVGRQWQPMRDAMLHDATTLPSTYLARIDTRPEPEAGGQVMATDLINGARGPLMLPGVDFDPGSVVCFTWTPEGPQIRNWMTGRLWNACTAHAACGFRRRGRATMWRHCTRARHAEREIRAAEDAAVAVAEQILRSQSRH